MKKSILRTILLSLFLVLPAVADAQITFERWYGGTDDDYGYSVAQTSDEGYIVAGCTRSFGAGGSDVYLIKTDATGNAQWAKTFGGVNSDYGRSVAQTSDGGYIITGYTHFCGEELVYLIKTDGQGLVGIDDNGGITPSLSLFQNYPNPMQSSTTIGYSIPKNIKNVKIEIYNIKGQLVKQLKTKNLKFKINKVAWDGRDENGTL